MKRWKELPQTSYKDARLDDSGTREDSMGMRDDRVMLDDRISMGDDGEMPDDSILLKFTD